MVVGALFTTNFHPVATLDTVVNTGLISAIADNAGIFLFLVLLGIIVAVQGIKKLTEKNEPADTTTANA